MKRIDTWVESLFENPNTSIMGITQLAMALVIFWELYKGTITPNTGLPLAATSLAGGVGNLLAGDASRKRRKNYSEEPAGDCSTCKFKREIGKGQSVCKTRAHMVSDRDTCDNWKPVTEIHITNSD